MTTSKYNYRKKILQELEQKGHISLKRALSWYIEQIRLCDEEIDKLQLEKEILYMEADTLAIKIVKDESST